MSHLAILGNTPELSSLELERLGLKPSWPGGQVAEIAKTIPLEQLGGTVKMAETISTIGRDMNNINKLLIELQNINTQDTKLRFGFSVYAAEDGISNKVLQHYSKKLRAIGIEWKKKLRSATQSVRLVESKEPDLSSVIVNKEHLLDHQTDFIIGIRKKDILLGRTIAVQDYKAYSDRDFGRPQRDHHSGMLPPKIARMMVNIAQPNSQDVLLDPFCGSGTILQEALSLGYNNLIGSDISKKAIEDTAANLKWLSEQKVVTIPKKIPLHVCDVLKLGDVIQPQSVNCIVGEGYLGPVQPKKTEKIHRQMTQLYGNALPVLADVLVPGGRIVLAVPAWQRYEDILTLPLEGMLANIGLSEFHEPIFYSRQEAKVVRQIICLEKKPAPAYTP